MWFHTIWKLREKDPLMWTGQDQPRLTIRFGFFVWELEKDEGMATESLAWMKPTVSREEIQYALTLLILCLYVNNFVVIITCHDNGPKPCYSSKLHLSWPVKSSSCWFTFLCRVWKTCGPFGLIWATSEGLVLCHPAEGGYKLVKPAPNLVWKRRWP